MVRNGNQYEERLRALRLRLAGRRAQLDYAGRLPAGRSQRPEVVAVSHAGQAGEHVAQVNRRIFAVALAGDDQRVNDRRALAGVGMADKQPVLFTNGRGADGAFHQVIVDAGLSVAHMSRQRVPLVEQVRTSLAQQRTGQDPSLQSLRQRPQPAQRTGKVFTSEFCADLRLDNPGFVPSPLTGIKSADQL